MSQKAEIQSATNLGTHSRHQPTLLVVVMLGLGLVLPGCSDQGVSISADNQTPDPVVVDFPMAYVKRPIPVQQDDNGAQALAFDNLRMPISFNPGAALYIKERAAPDAPAVNVTAQAFAEGALVDVKDLEVSFDGSQIIFAMRAPEIEDLDEDEQPTWNIWQYDYPTRQLRRVIESDIVAEAGDDVAPHYLPDGRIVFSSTRQRQAKAVLLDEGKPQFTAQDEDLAGDALALHVMSSEGSDIRQITFNQSHDRDPALLANGKIVFSRWDNYSRNAINLYQVNPDGSGLEILYGMHSHASGSDGALIDFIEPRLLEDGRLLVKLKPNLSQRLGGELVYLDWQNYTDINQSSLSASAVPGSGSGQSSATPYSVRSDDAPSAGGRFADMYPLFDGTRRMLVSWTPCRLDALDAQNNPIIQVCTEQGLASENAVEALPLYGIWIFDPVEGTQLPLVVGEEGVVYHQVVALAPRTLPDVVTPLADLADPDLISQNLGLVDIRSVYDLDGQDSSPQGIAALADPLQTTAEQRPIRFLRVNKAVSLPERDLVELDGADFGRSSAELMKEILGYVPVEPDGSAQFAVPAQVAFSLDLLDATGKRVGGRHSNWMSVAAGEVKQCPGCHSRDSELPHGRLDAQAPTVNPGALSSGLAFANTQPSLAALQGETMAQTFARLKAVRRLSVNLNYSDDWTDPALRSPDPDLTLSYSQLSTPAPTSPACQAEWSGVCRIVINYEQAIQPMLDLPRQTFDGSGNLLSDHSCGTCHSPTDASGQVQVPAGQLELLAAPSTDQPAHLLAYRELFFGDNEQEIVDGILVDRLVQAVDAEGNPVFATDQDGNLIYDDQGNPVPVMVPVAISPPMNVNSALSNDRFFSLFASGGSHQDWLSSHELRLFAEWLDLGAQYYNDPFDVPQ